LAVVHGTAVLGYPWLVGGVILMTKRIALFLLVTMMLVCLVCDQWSEESVPPLIRLHILANSDSQADQQLKYMVRDQVIEEMSIKFKDSQSLGESRQIIRDNLPLLEQTARETLKKLGSSYDVRAAYGVFSFPTRYYGDFTLPAGEYEAVRLIIGNGEGANWWCVLFPPLCFVSGEKQNAGLQMALAKDKSGLGKETQKIYIRPASKLWELWQNFWK
jgi:stage II sporulation protein R